MKTNTATAGLLVLALFFTSCAGKPVAATDWNQLKIWRKIGDNPSTYVPTSYASSLPRTEKEGQWFTDRRDGKRLFVPNETTGQWSREVLFGEAKKITNYKAPKPPKSIGDLAKDIGAAVLMLPVAYLNSPGPLL